MISEEPTEDSAKAALMGCDVMAVRSKLWATALTGNIWAGSAYACISKKYGIDTPEMTLLVIVWGKMLNGNSVPPVEYHSDDERWFLH